MFAHLWTRYYMILIVGAPEETTNYLKMAHTELSVSLTYAGTMFWTRHIMPVVPSINCSIKWMAGGFAALQVAPTRTTLPPRPVVAPWVISTCPLTLRAAPFYIIYSPIPPIPRWIQIIAIVSSVVVQTTISTLHQHDDDQERRENDKSFHFARFSSI